MSATSSSLDGSTGASRSEAPARISPKSWTPWGRSPGGTITQVSTAGTRAVSRMLSRNTAASVMRTFAPLFSSWYWISLALSMKFNGTGTAPIFMQPNSAKASSMRL